MPEMDDLPPTQGAQPAGPDRARIQRSVLEEQVELWWFRDPAKSLLCYSVAVLLILGCGLGGVLLLSSTTSFSSDWRMGAGTTLCLLALAVLLKQLLSSAVQDMNCVRNRRRIEILKSGGLSDLLVVLVTGLCLVVCGAALLKLALEHHMPKPGVALNDMYVAGVVLLAGGGAAVVGAGLYAGVVQLLERTGHGRRFWDRALRVFTISGRRMDQGRRETTSSLANLI
ncbi:transmembrane protein 125 [Esox lucius]|uniref:Transmembrane protein 125 n=1 Tax=Esox lucius TaxID=8010 RepID=A0AAY5L0E0_ESOLU|nr:transmembrane protein 125 [Esox lucius]